MSNIVTTVFGDLKTDAFEMVHISQIKVGDTIFHNGFWETVNKEYLRYSSFMGHSYKGNNYRGGRILVKRRLFINWGLINSGNFKGDLSKLYTTQP